MTLWRLQAGGVAYSEVSQIGTFYGVCSLCDHLPLGRGRQRYAHARLQSLQPVKGCFEILFRDLEFHPNGLFTGTLSFSASNHLGTMSIFRWASAADLLCVAVDRVLICDFFAFCREVLPYEIAKTKRNR